jgi:flagellar hook assembly protein FlgD
LTIYAVDGRKVRTLVEGWREAGRWDAVWDGTDDRGTAVPSGVYYARLVTRDVERTLAISLVK